VKYHHYLKSLHYFLVTAEFLSIKQAALELSVTQAAISQQIRLLEEALGVTLFIRHHRALELSVEGLQLLPSLKVAFSSIEEGVESLLGDADPNKVTVSVSPSFASRWLIPKLGRFYEAHPNIEVNLNMSDKLETFSGKGSDLAIRFGRGKYEGLESHFLMEEFIYPVCHPSYIAVGQIDHLEDLKSARLFGDIAHNLSWAYWLQAIRTHYCQQSQNIPVPRAEDLAEQVGFDGSHYVIDSVLTGQGVAMVRHSLAAEMVAQGSLRKLLGFAAPLNEKCFICAPAHYFRRSKVKCFMQWLAQEAKEFSSQYPV